MRHAFALPTHALLLLSLYIAFSFCRTASAAVESPHETLTLDCQQCHSTAGWKELRAVMDFSHDTQTKYPLIGRHKGVSCISCHATLVFSEAGAECLDCHTDVHRGQFTANCGECHTPQQWADEHYFRKMHETTRMPLVGVHATLDCQSCHATGQYANLATDCGSCHAAEFAATTDPNHTTANFSRNCSECHDVSVAKWQNPTFFHPQEFPLTGGHALNDCRSCHSTGYANTSGACVECHAADYASALNPTHDESAFPSTCEQCHTTTGWRPASFANHEQTAFRLTGAHLQASCAQCHIGGQYTGISTICVECHAANYTSATNPAHDGDAFPNTCDQCHTTMAWRPAEFENHNVTLFPLTGAHILTDCAECHVGGQFTGTPTDCWSCHEEEYAGTTNPDHAAGQYPQSCTDCHSTDNWTETTFDHGLTGFPLTGAHILADCAECHVGGQFPGTPTDCWSCHEPDYIETTDPNHVTEMYPQNCTICHSTDNWTETTFDHNLSDFPLTGAHIQTDCAQCHVGGQYTGTPTDCWSCHEADYIDAEDHVENNYPHDCAQCHNTTDWDSDFNHNATGFPLTGAHVQTTCLECHIGGVFEGTPTDCWSCHEADYNDAEDHVENNYPHDCTQCHNTTDWDSDFNHNATGFPLTGAHVSVNCLACHVGGQFENTPTDCWFCHQADFNSASPDHNTGYPQECVDCHTTNNWNSTFNHDQQHFPIYSGRHDEEWNQCIECHTTSGSFSLFSCIECHEHNDQGDVDDQHEDVGGYTYTPTSCYECHPDGDSGPNRRTRPPRKVPPNKTEVHE